MVAIAAIINWSGGQWQQRQWCLCCCCQCQWWDSSGGINRRCTDDNDGCHCHCHHWPKMPSPPMPLHHCPSIPLQPPLTTTTVNKDHHPCGCHWSPLRQGLPPLPSLMTNNNRWLLAVIIVNCVAAAMAVFDGSDSGHHQWWRQWNWANGVNCGVVSMMAAVDGGGNNGIFTTAAHDDDRHPCPHCLYPCPPSDKDWIAGWRACRDTSLLLLPWSSLLVPSLSLTKPSCMIKSIRNGWKRFKKVWVLQSSKNEVNRIT